ncbi:sulfite exporter TauE/SafE family protein [Candidatus Uhrbacteria bacterium]|nr:sulfite exporter TauE/SafE family protein [Candidatus Uhrbacteria bacterium]
MKQDDKDIKKVGVDILGMTCQSCEVLIERKWKKIPGVVKVDVNHATGHAVLTCSRIPYMSELRESVKDDGYQVTTPGVKATIRVPEQKNTKTDYMEMGTVFMIIFGLYMIFKEFKLIPENIGISDSMSYGIVFVIGLVAAMSTCIAVSGGLLLTLAAEYNKQFPHLSGLEKFKPHAYFNAGRVVSYTVFGGLIGAVGSVFTLSPFLTGVIMVVASCVMILLGFRLLNIFPALQQFQLRMPKFLAHKIHDAGSGKHTNISAVFLGAATFFLPCGFTQALQLYVLSKGDAVTGALTMFVFSLGTLPALLSVGAISSFAKGAFQRYFLKFSGVFVVLIGFFTVSNGLALAGLSIDVRSLVQRPAQESQNRQLGTAAPIVDGKQVVEMNVKGYQYAPSRFVVRQGIPVEWRIDGKGAAGCAQVLVAPKLGITKYLSTSGTTVIDFTPQEVGTFAFSCSMGMTTPGAAFTVVPNSGS